MGQRGSADHVDREIHGEFTTRTVHLIHISPLGDLASRRDARGSDQLTQAIMRQPERQLEAITASLAESVDQQSEECMKPLFGLTEVADAQKLQRPLIDSIHPDFIFG
jgi:hypothetical protein